MREVLWRPLIAGMVQVARRATIAISLEARTL